MKNPFNTPLNARTVTVKMKRIDLCDILLALTTIRCNLEGDGLPHEKWDKLHDKLEKVLDDFDAKQEIE